MDATILVLQDLNFDNIPFFSLKTELKTDSISHIRWQGISNSNNCNYKYAENINRWTGFLLAGTKQSPLFDFMKNIFYSYWKNQNDLIDYLFIDYVLAIACDKFPSINTMINNVPLDTSDNIHELENNLNSVYSDEIFKIYTERNFHKLTWKKDFYSYTDNNSLTIYGYLLKTYL
jgi:hypothetical protein